MLARPGARAPGDEKEKDIDHDGPAPPASAGPSRGRRRGTPLSEQEELARLRAAGDAAPTSPGSTPSHPSTPQQPVPAGAAPGRRAHGRRRAAAPGAEPETGPGAPVASAVAAEPAPAPAPATVPATVPAPASPAPPPEKPAPAPERSAPAAEASAPAAPDAQRRALSPLSPFRPELQGLRAVAILMVVCYHIWFGRVSGGVDIFLLISAFLLTGSFARKLETGRPLQVPSYWIHAFKRLLPPSALVILATLAGIFFLLPQTRWSSLLTEALAAGTSWENWLLALQSVDYYAADHSTASPFQHFWSLSIQGQVFLLWPLLFALAALAAKILRARPRTVMLVLFSAITAASFAWSVHLTAADQTFAYFDTRTRLWEFSLGSVIALVLPSIERRLRYRQADGAQGVAALRAGAGWIGLALILSAGWVIDVEGAFPGYVALWPLLAAALVIIAGPTHTRWGADRLLSSRPLQWLGDISYALYLVHWPLLVFALVATGTGHAGPLLGTGLVTASIALAWLVTIALDRPIRTSRRLRERWWRGALVVLTSLTLIIGPSVGWARVLDQQQERFAAQAAPADNPGARVLAEGYVAAGDPDAPVVPALGARTSDWASDEMTGWCDEEPGMDIGGLAHLDCAHLVAPEEPTRRVVAVGNSHTDQWMAALIPIAQRQDWDLVIVRRPACFFTSAEDNPAADCDAWLGQAEAFIARHDPDAVLIQSTFTTRDGTQEVIREGTEAQVSRWTEGGATVLGIRDNPRFATSHEECELSTKAESCSFEHVAATTPDPTAGWEESHPGYAAIDMNDVICPEGRCPSIIGNVYVYLDDNHITATYARSAAPQLEDRLLQAFDRSAARRADAAPGEAS
ncbi:acyltransferase family protein [Brachybacterium phenoliresistens]|uniref:acyltransferase family protein n=1 Tax=Brachybacterium phenoliresistens TaxID=396014 RepID=UPI0031E269E3